jgi:2-oxoglutarate ferredoxin oxidoreductase subunit gamma
LRRRRGLSPGDEARHDRRAVAGRPDRSLALLEPGALVIVDERLVPEPPRRGFDLHVLPISQRAVAAGSSRIANVVALGALARLSRVCRADSLEQAVRLETPAKFAALNLAALREGFALTETAPAQ